MSDTRHTHPGYYGVLMGISVPWYGGLGATFLLQGDGLKHVPSYRLGLHYVPATVWGVVYTALAVVLVAAANWPRVPHRYVRGLVFFGWCLTIFFLSTLVLYDFEHGIPPATLIPAFVTMLIVEYRALVEPASNPLSQYRPRRPRKPK